MTDKAVLSCSGRCDGMGDLSPAGSFVKMIYREGARGLQISATHHIQISEGEAELLIAELRGALAQRPQATGCEHQWVMSAELNEIQCPHCETIR